jgi:hypothetical protein
MFWTMILSLIFRIGFLCLFGNCLSQAYLLKCTLRFWPEDVDRETAAELGALLGIPPDSNVLSQACQRTDLLRQAGAFAASALYSLSSRNLNEAKLSAEWPEWESACHKELENMADKKGFELVDPPPGARVIDCGWVFANKLRHVGTIGDTRHVMVS